MEVHLVFNNADMGEGKGPMILHSAHSTFDLALDELKQQPGVQYRTPYGIDSEIISIKLDRPENKYRRWVGYDNIGELKSNPVLKPITVNKAFSWDCTFCGRSNFSNKLPETVKCTYCGRMFTPVDTKG